MTTKHFLNLDAHSWLTLGVKVEEMIYDPCNKMSSNSKSYPREMTDLNLQRIKYWL